MRACIDIGGTNIRVASADNQTGLLGEVFAMPNSPDYERNVRDIETAISRFGGEVTAIGVGTPGVFSEDDSVMVGSTNLRQWVGQPSINCRLEERFGCRVVKANDTFCGALGEAMASDTCDPFKYIGYGTGIGTAWVTYEDGVPKVKLPEDETVLSYMRSWEADCSGNDIKNIFGKSAGELDDAEWKIITGNFANHLRNFIELFEPQAVVLGGGVSVKQAGRLRAMLVDFRQTYPQYQDCHFSFAKHGERSALFGALALLD